MRYTGNGSQQPANRVVFEYVDRPAPADTVHDRSETYHEGGKRVSISRLAAVRTYVNWPANVSPMPATAVKVKVLKLSYTQGPDTKRSNLTAVRECVGAAETQCMPATTFAYSAGGSEAYQANSPFNLLTEVLHDVNGTAGIIPADFTGDGRTDLIRWSDDPSLNRFYRSNGNGTFTAVPVGSGTGQFNLTANRLFHSNGCYASMVADFNGDGLPDILRYAASATVVTRAPCASGEASRIFLSKGDGSFIELNISGPTLSRSRSIADNDCPNGFNCEPGGIGWTAGQNFYFLDVNGDGKADVITTLLLSRSPTGSPSGSCATGGCTQVYFGNGAGVFTSTPTNLDTVSVYAEPSGNYSPGEPSRTADINGDGLADLHAGGNPFTGGSGTKWVSRGDGNFDPVTSGQLCAIPIDFNADGRSDCLSALSDIAANNALRLADGSNTSQKVADFNLIAAGDELAGDGAGVVVADFNGDGRGDILRWKDNPTDNRLYLSNGDGKFSTSTRATPCASSPARSTQQRGDRRSRSTSTLIHSRLSQSRLPPLAQYWIGAVAQI